MTDSARHLLSTDISVSYQGKPRVLRNVMVENGVAA
jgi:hypothetical protein